MAELSQVDAKYCINHSGAGDDACVSDPSDLGSTLQPATTASAAPLALRVANAAQLDIQRGNLQQHVDVAPGHPAGGTSTSEAGMDDANASGTVQPQWRRQAQDGGLDTPSFSEAANDAGEVFVSALRYSEDDASDAPAYEVRRHTTQTQ